ncbi:MAG TPA: hypothetical protein VF767_03050 [Bryobacteraceae bacterium]
MKRLLTVILFAALVGGLAQAQTYEFGIFGGYARFSRPALGSLSPESATDTDTRLKANYVEGAWIGLNTRGYLGNELSYARTNSTLRTTERTLVNGVTVTTIPEDRIRVDRAAYNFLLFFMPNGSRWRPYVTGGAQAQQYQGPHFAWPRGSRRHYGVNWGGGIKLIPMAHTLFRLDLREYIGGKPYGLSYVDSTKSGGTLKQYEATAGFAITF